MSEADFKKAMKPESRTVPSRSLEPLGPSGRCRRPGFSKNYSLLDLSLFFGPGVAGEEPREIKKQKKQRHFDFLIKHFDVLIKHFDFLMKSKRIECGLLVSQ